MSLHTNVRERSFSDFHAEPHEGREGVRQWLMQAHNFSVEWVEMDATADTRFEFGSEFESLLIVRHGAVHIAPARAGMPALDAAAHSVCIVPPGRYGVSATAAAELALIASQRHDLAGRRRIAAEACEPRDPRVLPAGQPYRRRRPLETIEVLDIDAVRASADKPRLKMLQTETLSINIVEYEGPRDRSQLSPHKHASFEQGSLAIAGHFVHHLRLPWSNDANTWRDDEHLAAGSPSLLIVPVEVIHTSEGVGDGPHFLVDVFSPPRTDFIDKGWVFNAADYEATAR